MAVEVTLVVYFSYPDDVRRFEDEVRMLGIGEIIEWEEEEV